MHDAVVLGDVSGGEDAGRAGLQIPVHETPLSVSSPARCASAMSGVTPAPIATKSHSISSPDFVTTLAHPILALEALELLPAVHLHAVLGEHVLDEAADLRAVDALEGHVLEHHDLALLAERRERRRQLGADVAAADQRNPLGVGGLLTQRIGVPDRAQVVDPIQVRAVNAQDPHVRPCRQQRLLEADLLLGRRVRRRGRPGPTIDARAREHFHALLGVPLSGRNSTSSRDSSPRRYPFDSGGRL